VLATSWGFGVCRKICPVAIAVIALATSGSSASAQNIFEKLFGRPWFGPTAYADPSSQLNPFGGREMSPPEATGAAYCVRLCDGRYFPIERHPGISPAQACSSFCPASATKIYSGGSIEHAFAPDGKRYTELATAFTYREKLIPGCTCNGKDAFGLVTRPVAEDPTLRPGDIVATNAGLMAYDGGPGRQASFTPIYNYGGLSQDLRRQLTETKIAPAAERAVPAPAAKQADAVARSSKNKRAQVER
jgi:Protein of unknown function (DUF2865)